LISTSVSVILFAMTRLDRAQDWVSVDADPQALASQIRDGDPEQLNALASLFRDANVAQDALRSILSAVRRRADTHRRADDASDELRAALGGLETAVQEALADHRQAAAKTAAKALARATPLRRAILVELASGPATPKHLTGVVGRTPESISRTLKEMLADGVVAVDDDPQDGRKRVYALTPAGEVQAADSVTYVDAAITRSEPVAHNDEELLRETLSAAVALRRRSSRRKETIERLAVVRRHADHAGADMVALEALQETIATLRQAGRAAETGPYIEQLSKCINDADGAFRPSTMLPALGFLEYELGRHRDTELSARAGHLVTSSHLFSRLALRSDEANAGRWHGRQAWALVSLADNLRQQSELGKALHEVRSAERIFREHDDSYGVVRSMFVAGFCLRLRGQFSEASSRLETARGIARDEGFAAFEADALMQLGEVRRCQGELDIAVEMLDEAYARASRLELPLTQAFAQSALAAANHAQGSEGVALGQLIEAHELFERRGHRDGLALNLRRRAVVSRQTSPDRQGLAEAKQYLDRAREIYVDLRSPAGIVACNVEVGQVAVAAGDDPTDACRDLQAVLDTPTSRRMLELDPWVPPLVLDFAEHAGDAQLQEDAESLVAQNARTMEEHRTETETDAEVIPLCLPAATAATGYVAASRHVDPMAGEPRRLRPESHLAAA
jgi:DNA-binding MarR family transcriptional regulator